VSTAIVKNPFNVFVKMVFWAKIVIPLFPSMEIGVNGSLGQAVQMNAIKDETVLVMIHHPQVEAGIAQMMGVTQLKHENVRLTLIVMKQLGQFGRYSVDVQ